MVTSDFTVVTSVPVKIDVKVKIAIKFYDFSFYNACLPHFPPSEVGIYGYQQKGLEISYTLVAVASPYVPCTPSYRVNKKFRNQFPVIFLIDLPA